MRKELIINKSKTIIVILAGGQSRRFGGGYKTLYTFNKMSILDRIIQNFKKLEVEIVLNANSNEDQFLKTGLHLIKDELENFQGPLAGICSSMKWVLENRKNIEWIFTSPSDTPFLNKNLLLAFGIPKNNILFCGSDPTKKISTASKEILKLCKPDFDFEESILTGLFLINLYK